MIKLIGSILIIFSSFLLGFSKSYELKERSYFINNLITFLKFAKTEIISTRNTINQVIEKYNNINKHNSKKIINFEESLKCSYLKSTEKNLIINFFNIVATSSILEIDQIIDDYIRQLNELYIEAKQEYYKNAKLFSILGALCGISICIILF
ncbi:stage III sporulation protein AB [Caldicellulosiruptoraceae bacterium PP1]